MTVQLPTARPRSDKIGGRPTEAPPRRPRPGSGTILLPPWSRAPWLGFRQPAVLIAVIAAAVILACAASSAELFLSSSSSAALQRLIAARCPDAARPAIQARDSQSGATKAPDSAGLDRSVTAAMTASGLPKPYRIATHGGDISSATMVHLQANPQAMLFYEDAAIAHLPHAATANVGSGVWIDQTTAGLLRAKPGDTISFSGVKTRLAGIYRPPTGSALRTFWCSQSALFYNQGVNDDFPPKLILATDYPTFTRIAGRVGGLPLLNWVSPVDPHGMTMHRARTINREAAGAMTALSGTAKSALHQGMRLTPQAGGSQNALPQMTQRASLIRRGLTGPVVPVAIGGSILALLLMGAAGSYWADRRARETRLLSSRGVGPVALATKAGLELTLPAVIGTALGWLLAVELIRSIGPSPDLDPAAPWQAGATAAIGLGGGVLLLSTVAGLRARNMTERPIGHRARWAALVPWELAILAAAALVGLRLSGERAVTLINDVAQVNMLLVAFPLLFLTGAVAVAVRLVAFGLPLLRRVSTRWPVAGYFAVRRITGATLVSVTLVAAASLPVAVVVYSGGITATSRDTVNAKSLVYVGAPVAVSTVDKLHHTAALDRVATPLVRYSQVKIGGQDAEVLAVDPATFARFAFWDHRFADKSLPQLMSQLAHAQGLPAIVIGDYGGNPVLQMDTTVHRLNVIARPEAFPGQRDQYSDLVVVDAARLGKVDQNVDYSVEAWGRADAATIQTAMIKQGARPFVVYTPHGLVDPTNYLAVTWTFGYLESLAVLVGVVAIAALLLYVGTRQRSRTASYAMASRMGLSRRAHLRSLLLELGGLLAAAYVIGAALSWVATLIVYKRMDVDPSRRPAPLLAVPTTAFVASAVAVAVIAVIVAAFAQWAADRANPSEVMRLDA